MQSKRPKGMVTVIDIVYYYTAMYYTILTCQPFSIALKDI